MKEGGAEYIERAREAAEEVLQRAKEAVDFAISKAKEYAPGSREVKFLLRMAAVTLALGAATPEARGEPTKMYQREVEQLEQDLRRATALMEHNVAGGETMYRDASIELRQTREEWARERTKDANYVDLGKYEDDLASYGVHVVTDEAVKRVPREIRHTWSTDYRVIEKDVQNGIQLKDGKIIPFDISTVDVKLEPVRGGVDLLAYQLNGAVHVYKIRSGTLSDTGFADHESQLPYEDIQKKYERKEKRAQFGLPKSGKAPF
jgi:hypothetical protein